MVKMTATTGDGRTIVIVGMSQANVDRIKAGEPLVWELKDVGIPSVIVTVMFVETEDAIAEEMRGTGIKINREEDRR